MTERTNETQGLARRAGKLAVSIGVLSLVTVVLGYGGWAVVTVSAKLGGPDPETESGDLLRERLLTWPDRNREVMRTDGRADPPWKP